VVAVRRPLLDLELKKRVLALRGEVPRHSLVQDRADCRKIRRHGRLRVAVVLDQVRLVVFEQLGRDLVEGEGLARVLAKFLDAGLVALVRVDLPAPLKALDHFVRKGEVVVLRLLALFVAATFVLGGLFLLCFLFRFDEGLFKEAGRDGFSRAFAAENEVVGFGELRPNQRVDFRVLLVAFAHAARALVPVRLFNAVAERLVLGLVA